MTGMNGNAKMYEQSVPYSASEGPYQCLSLPWWVQTSYPTYYPRHRCELEPLICGEAVFRKIEQDLKKAKHTVDIITWGFDPGMVLRRGATAKIGQRYGDLLKEIATRKKDTVMVRLLVWHDNRFTESLMKNNPGYYGTRLPAVGCASGGYSTEEHRKYNAEWFEQVCAEKIPNICLHVRSLPIDLFPHCLQDEQVPAGAAAGATARCATHHQKMMLIDYENPPEAIGYVMGHNSITDFWDTAEHKFRDPRRETFYTQDPEEAWKQGPAFDHGAGAYLGQYQPGESELALKEQAMEAFRIKNTFVTKPYQDVSVRLRGPVLYDLNHNFCQAWGESTPPTPGFLDWYWLAIKKTLLRNLFTAPVSRVVQIYSDKADDFGQRRAKLRPEAYKLQGGQHSVQLMRTQPLHGEKTIKECYANLTRQIQHYIFIQNQYVQYEAWAIHLKECVQRLRNGGFLEPIYVFILTSKPERDGMDIAAYDVAKNLGMSAAMEVEHAEAVEKARKSKAKMPITPDEMTKAGIQVVMGSLWTSADAPSKADDYEEIYIHAKVAIVDDAAFTVGSANLNLRSMAIDSELNILSQAKDVAYQLRADLFLQCSGSTGPTQFGDMQETFKDWKKSMISNTNAIQNRKKLTSQLVPFHVDRKPGTPLV